MGHPARQRLSAVHFFPELLLLIFPRDSGMGKNLRIHPIWSQINGKIANKTIHPLCKNIDEAQIVALAFLALGQMQTFLAELALAIPTQALRALRRRIEALQPCLFLSKMIFPVCSAWYFSFASCSNFRIFGRMDFRPDSFVCAVVSGLPSFSNILINSFSQPVSVHVLVANSRRHYCGTSEPVRPSIVPGKLLIFGPRRKNV